MAVVDMSKSHNSMPFRSASHINQAVLLRELIFPLMLLSIYSNFVSLQWHITCRVQLLVARQQVEPSLSRKLLRPHIDILNIIVH